MKVLTDRSFIEDVVKDSLKYLKKDSKVMANVKASMAQNNVKGGEISEILNNPEKLSELDYRFVGLLLDKIYQATGDMMLSLDKYFSRNEIIDIRNYYHEQEEEIDFPLELENVFQVAPDVWYCPISVQDVAKLLRHGLLYYNPEIQRQMKKIKRKDNIIQKPTINRTNVKEISQLLLKNELVDTTLAFNASIGTGDSGEEIDFNPQRRILTILKGTRLDILDGFHRALASVEAINQSSALDFNFVVRISNVTDRQAQAYQAQLAKATPFAKARIKQLEASRQSDFIVKQLLLNSDLKGRVSSGKQLSYSMGEIVNYATLTDAIDIVYNSKNKVESIKIAEELTEFFDYFLAVFNDRFEKREKGDYFYKDIMFYGYVALAKAMTEKGIEISKIKKIISNAQINSGSPIWEEIGINMEGRLDKNTGRKLVKYFNNLV